MDSDELLEYDEVDGNQYWYLKGKLHRIGGPAVIHKDGSKMWYCHGKLHRTDGPAITNPDGTEMWYNNDKIHRVNGPAVVYCHLIEEYWIDNIKYEDIEEYNKMSQKIQLDSEFNKPIKNKKVAI